METYFFTQDHPHRWTSGPILLTLNPETWAPIASLDEARKLAEQHEVCSNDESRCITTYGVIYGEFKGVVKRD